MPSSGWTTPTTLRGLLYVWMLLLQSTSLGTAAKLNCSSPNPEGLITALEKELFPKKLFRPVQSFSTPINITIYFTLVGVLDVSESEQTVTTFLWQVLQWDIEDLSWDEEQCGTWRIAVPREGLWIPDITIAEFCSTNENISPVYPYIYLENNGHVFDNQPLHVVSACKLGIYSFPFDIQNCTLTFGSFLHFANDIQTVIGRPGPEILKQSLEVLETNREWELINIIPTHNRLELMEGTYDQIVYYVVLKRRPMRYVVNLVLPSCFLIIIDLFSFLLPSAEVDRATFKITLILGYTVFLIMANDLLPVTGETTPIISVFFTLSLALMVTSLLETVFITNIQTSSSHYPAVPRWLRVIVLDTLAHLLCLPLPHKPKQPESGTIKLQSVETINKTTNEETEPPLTQMLEPVLMELRQLSTDLDAIRNQMDKHFLGNQNTSEWIHIGKVLDRLLFLLHIIFISVSFITIICVWSFWYRIVPGNG
ncbi:hypothetical protein DPEC_G00272700 [Dallia pectoralis]|uniref:Uncharacterized protein n=1 Tax=Dallia pectoralis TaxID=75939 RepID=A0ACC2FQ36_DALPE|nr:hypothetical protein DPEC_G00272700 [Dallia pectoralis]